MPTEQERRAAFVQQYLPFAQKWAAQTGIPAEVFLAIGASESNYGAAGSIFGIKGTAPSGGSRSYATWEMVNGRPVQTTDTFAVYGSPDEGFQHFVSLVQSGRYKPAWDYLQQTGDAAGWLQRVNQAGYATDPQWHSKVMSIAKSTIAPITGGQVQGAARMPTSSTSGTTTTKRTTTPYEAQFTEAVNLAKAQLDEATKRVADVRARIEQTTDPNQRAALTQIELESAIKERDAAQTAYLRALQTAGTNTRETQTQNDPLAQAKLNYEIVRNALGDQLEIAQSALDLMKYNDDRVRNHFSDMVKRGEMAREDVSTLINAINMRQTQELASWAKGMETAKYISEERWNIVNRMLPQGMRYTFGPGDALFDTMQRAGMNPQPIQAVELPVEYLDPEQILARGQALAPRAPTDQEFGITELRSQIAQNRAIPWPTAPTEVQADDPRLNMPTGLNYNLDDVLAEINKALLGDDETEMEPQATPEQQAASAHLAGMGPQDWGAPASGRASTSTPAQATLPPIAGGSYTTGPGGIQSNYTYLEPNAPGLVAGPTTPVGAAPQTRKKKSKGLPRVLSLSALKGLQDKAAQAPAAAQNLWQDATGVR